MSRGDRQAMFVSDPRETGLVVAAYGRHCLVETPSGHRVVCHPRGKKNLVVVGDRVLWQATHDEGTIESIEPRRNLFYRQDEVRTKSFAANLDQVIILLAARPVFSEMQLARALVAAEAQNIQPIIVLNKRDLAEPFELAWNRLAPYREIGYAVIPMSVLSTDDAGMAELAPRIDRKVTLVLGPSGVGKSTLINRLVPAAGALTAEISHALNSGKHTTTSTTWYWIDSGRSTALIDSPGFQEFGLQHIDPTALAGLMPDVHALASQCRYYNCTHLHEPGCGVRAALDDPGPEGSNRHLDARRYRIYAELFAELARPRY
jgi:ribosome biogenesis GTPase